MPPTKHAKLGASASHRWMNCPGSIAAAEGIEDVPTIFSIEGTAAHEVGEICLRRNVDAEVLVGTHIEVPVNEDTSEMIEVTEEMADAVQVYLDHIRARIVELGGDDVEVFIEHQFDLSPLNPPGPMFGTSDCTLWAPRIRHLDVNDYKHGQGVAVDATENSQLMMYALGAIVELGKRPDTIRVTISQPRGHHPDGIIRSYDFGWQEMIDFKEELFERARATEDPDAPLNPGEHCRFCPAAPTCPAKRDQANRTALDVFDVVSPEEQTLPDPEAVTDEQLAFILQNAGQVMDWLRLVEAHVMRRMERGESFEGWKLVEGRSNRRWLDEEAFDRYLRGRGLKKDERYTSKLISPAQAEKALKSREGPPLPERLWEKPAGKLKMVPAADKRPAIERGAQHVFDVVS